MGSPENFFIAFISPSLLPILRQKLRGVRLKTAKEWMAGTILLHKIKIQNSQDGHIRQFLLNQPIKRIFSILISSYSPKLGDLNGYEKLRIHAMFGQKTWKSSDVNFRFSMVCMESERCGDEIQRKKIEINNMQKNLSPAVQSFPIALQWCGEIEFTENSKLCWRHSIWLAPKTLTGVQL